MSGRQDKKLRQLYRRDFHEGLDSLRAEVSSMVKAPPRWFPAKLWIRLQRIFLNI